MLSLRAVHIRRRFAPWLFVPFLVPLLVAGCGGSSDDPGTGPTGGGNQTFTATATPASATVARGGTTSTTLVYTVTGGLVLGGGMSINTPIQGFTINQTNAQTSASNVTLVQEVNVAASVPAGVYIIRFSKPLSGYTGSGTVYSAATANFTLTVTQ